MGVKRKAKKKSREKGLLPLQKKRQKIRQDIHRVQDIPETLEKTLEKDQRLKASNPGFLLRKNLFFNHTAAEILKK